MGVLKRTWLSLTRQVIKTSILFGIVFLLGNVIAGSYAVLQGTTNVENIIKSQLVPVISIELDNTKWTNAVNDKTTQLRLPPLLTAEELKMIGHLPYVRSFDYTHRLAVQAPDLKALIPSNLASDKVQSSDWQLIGTNYAPVMMIEENKATLVSGRTFSQTEIDQGQAVTIVSQELAQQNQLSVGDSLLVKNEIRHWNEQTSVWEIVETRPIGLRIIGVIEYNSKDDHLNNQMIVPNQILDTEHQASMTVYLDKNNSNYSEDDLHRLMIPNYHGIFLLNNVADIDQFVAEVESRLPEFHTIRKSNDIYTRVAGPLQQADRIANQVFFVSIGASVIVLMLVTILFLRDRKYELGILLSLGEKRGQIITQIFCELLVIAMVAITLSLITGNLLTAKVSESMIQDQLVNTAQSNQVAGDPWGDDYSFGVFSTKLSANDLASYYQISFNTEYIGLMYLVGVLTIGLSSIAPLIYILRLNPKTILT